MAEDLVKVENMDMMLNLFGNYDENIKLIEKHYNVTITGRGSDIKISGNEENVCLTIKAINSLAELAKNGENISEQSIRYIFSMIEDGTHKEIKTLTEDSICVTVSGKTVKPKTLGQKHYVDEIKNNTIVFGVGPAGTGKTYLAVAMAVKAFKAHDINKIILTRPAVEAGEKLGFLPGDLQNKVDPYLRPLYDALFEMMGAESFQKHFERGTIEVAPLAYMRGRTLDDSFIILDEAQNTTEEQMKMFLTRLGFNSKMVITGDTTQIDLPDSKRSGLIASTRILKDIDDISIVNFTEKDVVRHRLVQDIIKAYEKANQEGKIK